MESPILQEKFATQQVISYTTVNQHLEEILKGHVNVPLQNCCIF